MRRSASVAAAMLASGCAAAPTALPDPLASVDAAPVAAAAIASPAAPAPPAVPPAIAVMADDPTPGEILLTANYDDGTQPSWLLATDGAGATTFARRLTHRGFDFERHVAPDGGRRYTYVQEEGPQLEGVTSPVGTVRLLDGGFAERASLALLPNRGHGALPADIHAFVYLADDHYIVASSAGKRVLDVPGREGRETAVAAAIIQEVKAGEVLFEWDSTDFPAFYAHATEGADFGEAVWADYMHLNALAVDPTDGGLVVSFRHQDQVVKIDRATGAIAWRLGGADDDFGLTPDQRFSHQHDVRVRPDGGLTLFDNGNARQATRILTIGLDAVRHLVTGFDAFVPEARFSYAMGNAETLAGGGWFVGWGARYTGETNATEYGPDGRRRLSLRFEDPKYSSYRALKYPVD